MPTASVTFVPGQADVFDDGFSEVIQQAPSNENAADWVDRFDQMLEECPAITNDAGATTTFDRMTSFPDVGDVSIAAYVLHSAPRPTAVALIAVGDLVIYLTGTGDGISEIADVAAIAVDRATGKREATEVVEVIEAIPTT